MRSEVPSCLRIMQHYLAVRDLSPEAFQALIDFCIRRKGQFQRGELKPMLQGKVLAMIFQKSSLRTRLAFESAMAQLGGHAINLEDHQVGIGKREDAKDAARVISSMCNCISARVFAHQTVIELAAASKVPVINALSDWSHPCQALADMMTLQERFGPLAGRKVAFVGDSNNVARSLLNACAKLGVSFAIASPKGYLMESGEIEFSTALARGAAAELTVTSSPAEAVSGADAVYTDVWTSMGQEAEKAEREKAFAAYQVNGELMKKAKPTAVAMHCLPAHRGQEIADEVMDGPQSAIFQQAENRMHSQRALLEILMDR
jgi:ornithine carbamoyltransferase